MMSWLTLFAFISRPFCLSVSIYSVLLAREALKLELKNLIDITYNTDLSPLPTLKSESSIPTQSEKICTHFTAFRSQRKTY